MIDRQARDTAANVLQAFMDGAISNYKYEDGFPRSKDDPALHAIHVQLWFYYSDVRQHRLIEKHTLSPEARALYERSVLFLKSDLEFQWPPPQLKLRYGLLRLLGMGRTLKRREEKEAAAGEKQFWPFLKRDDYEKWLAKYQYPLVR
jgi:hypothetical protein